MRCLLVRLAFLTLEQRGLESRWVAAAWPRGGGGLGAPGCCPSAAQHTARSSVYRHFRAWEQSAP